MRATTSIFAGAALAAGAGISWGLWEASWFQIKRVDLALLPVGHESVRILHISDIHLMPHQQRKLSFIRSLSTLDADLVVNTGDNISSADSIIPLIGAFEGLRDVPGVFVFGSNDYLEPKPRNPLTYLKHGRSFLDGTPRELPWRELRTQFTAMGWKDLTHTRDQITVKGTSFAFRGTDDAHHQRDDYDAVAGPAVEADVNIALTHAPYRRLLDAMADDGMDLILAGHTHGGQVCVPGYGALITNCDLDTARVQGLSKHVHGLNMSLLHVSGGIGTSPYAPYRFACRPSATVLTLSARG